MKKELEGVLIEYALCKQIALQLQQSWVGDDVFVRPPVQVEENKAYLGIHDPDELFLAMSNLNYKEAVRKAVPHVKPAIAKSFVSVFTKIVYVLKRINDGHNVEVNSLYKGQSRSDCVAIFLALLELSKNSRIKFTDDNKYLHFVPKNKIEEEFSFGGPEESEAAEN